MGFFAFYHQILTNPAEAETIDFRRNMLETEYSTLDAIPENLRGAYVATDGKFVLDKLKDSHPKMVENKNLIEEKRIAESSLTAARGEITKLSNAKTLLENKALPDGYIAVKAEDAPIIEKFKAANVSLDDLTSAVKERDELRQEKQTRDEDLIFEAGGAAIKRNPSALRDHAKANGLKIKRETSEADGKTIEKFSMVKTVDGKEESTPLTEYVEKHANYIAPLEVKAKPGNGFDPPPASSEARTDADNAARAAQGRAVQHAF